MALAPAMLNSSSTMRVKQRQPQTVASGVQRHSRLVGCATYNSNRNANSNTNIHKRNNTTKENWTTAVEEDTSPSPALPRRHILSAPTLFTTAAAAAAADLWTSPANAARGSRGGSADIASIEPFSYDDFEPGGGSDWVEYPSGLRARVVREGIPTH